MPNVAEQLRHARERQNLSVYDVAEATKIKTDHVRALDEGTYNVFPAPVYIRGFVRTYAALVKLDVGKVMQDLESELSQSKQFRQPPSLSGQSQGVLDKVMLLVSKVNWQMAVGLAVIGSVLLISIFGYRAWLKRKSTDPLANLGPGIYQSALSNSGEILPLPGKIGSSR
jgi:cytoskeletal protein RodZ